MYAVITWNVKVVGSICIGCGEYERSLMARGKAEVMLEFNDEESKQGFVNDTGLTLQEPPKIYPQRESPKREPIDPPTVRY